MQGTASIRDYPWDALEPISRETVHAISAVRCAVADRVSVRELERGLGEVVGAEVRLAFSRYVDARDVETRPGALHFESSDATFAVSLSAEPQLADVLLARLLGQKAGIARGDAASNPALRGALSRIVVEAYRAIAKEVTLVASVGERRRNALAALGMGGTLIYDGKPYSVAASVRALRQRDAMRPAQALANLGRLPLKVPLSAACCVAPHRELASLSVGDAFLPGDGWSWTPTGGGRLGFLTPEHKSRAFFEPLDDRSAKLCPAGDQLAEGSSRMAEDEEETLPGSALDAVLDAPLVVHVEVATVTLPGRAWAELRPGDVVRTDQRLGERATLRIAGQAAATGELVNVEGELGIRIRHLIEGGNEEE